jgi:hypothetical protein
MNGAGLAREAAELEAAAAFDAWVAGMGGYAGERFAQLRREALAFAGPDGYSDYLDMARALDEYDAALGRRRQAERRAREVTRRTEEAAAAVLERSTELLLAARQLSEDPRVSGEWDLGAGPGMTSAEVALELRFALGIAGRAPTAYMASLPPVGDLARTIGLRS